MSTSVWKQTHDVRLGERVVASGAWSEIVDWKPGNRRYDPATSKHRDTTILIVAAPEGLREITFWSDENISVRPPL